MGELLHHDEWRLRLNDTTFAVKSPRKTGGASTLPVRAGGVPWVGWGALIAPTAFFRFCSSHALSVGGHVVHHSIMEHPYFDTLYKFLKEHAETHSEIPYTV